MNVKEILLQAADRVARSVDLKYIDDRYMCKALYHTIYSSELIQEVIKIGFTRENFHKFIKEKLSYIGMGFKRRSL